MVRRFKEARDISLGDISSDDVSPSAYEEQHDVTDESSYNSFSGSSNSEGESSTDEENRKRSRTNKKIRRKRQLSPRSKSFKKLGKKLNGASSSSEESDEGYTRNYNKSRKKQKKTNSHDWRLSILRSQYYKIMQNDELSLRMLRNISQFFKKPDPETGEKKSKVPRSKIRLEGSNSARSNVSSNGGSSRTTSPRISFQKYDRVEAKIKGWTKYYGGEVICVNSDGTYDIKFDDGEKKSKVKTLYMRSVKKR
eukprot:g664.t1